MEEWFTKHRQSMLVAVMVIAVFFRFWQIADIPPGLFTDEAVNGVNALEALETGEFKVFYTDNNGREGLFINIQALSVAIFGNKAWALRIVSGLFGSLTVLGLYFLARALFRRESVAIFASFFLATSFWHINFSRIGFRAIMAPFFLVWGLYFIWKLADERELEKSLAPVSLRSFFAGIIFGLGFHSYIAYRVAPVILVPIFYHLVRRNWKGNKNKIWFVSCFFALGIALAILPLAVYFFQHPQDFMGRTSQISVFSSSNPPLQILVNTAKTVGMFYVAGDFNWRHNYAGAPQLVILVAILFMLGHIMTIFRIFQRGMIFKVQYAILWIWFLSMLAPVIISNEGLPHALRAIIVAPVAMIFAALGMDWLVSKLGTKKSLIMVSTVAIVCVLYTFNMYFFLWANNLKVAESFSKDWTDAGNYLNSLPREKSKYAIMELSPWGPPMSMYTVKFLSWGNNVLFVSQNEEKNIPADAVKIWIK